MAVVAVPCPECGSDEVVRYERQPNGEQRFRCNNRDCARRIFLLRYHNTGWEPAVKQQMVEMALNGSGIRNTARVLGVSPTTVPPAQGKHEQEYLIRGYADQPTASVRLVLMTK